MELELEQSQQGSSHEVLVQYHTVKRSSQNRRIRRWRHNLTPAELKFKTPMLDHQVKYMMKAQRLLASFQDHELEGGDTRSQDGIKDNDVKIKIQDHSIDGNDKVINPQCILKEKMEELYAKFIDIIKEVRINLPLIDVLAGMPNYEKLLEDPEEQDLGRSWRNHQSNAIFIVRITLCEYIETHNDEIRLANHTYQYLMGVDENMLVQVGKFVFPVDFVILEVEEDSKVPLILRRPFLRTADAIIRVKSKELNLGVEDDRITFLIDKVMQHSHSNDDTCFCMDVIDEVTKEELDELLNNSKPFLSMSENINETFLDKEFEEFMAVDIEEIPEQEEEINDNVTELPLKEKIRIKTSI
nr:reverse transcriptase domain-containing protein [Tanacetum cinerariifolium]